MLWTMITSVQNTALKRWKKLKTRKGRKEYQSFLIEGEHLIQEAIRAGAKFVTVMVEEEQQEKWEKFFCTHQVEVPCYVLPAPIFQSLVETETPQGAMAEIEMHRWEENDLLQQGTSTFLLLDEVQDPGNVGTLLRTAQGMGITGVYLGHGTVDLYNPKVVRASMGALFHVPIFPRNLELAIQSMKQKGITIVGTSPHAGQCHFEYPFPSRTAILLGNEGRGVNPDVLAQADVEVQIPMPGNTESFNVSVTGAILMYERVRQSYR
ncbi:RNA methyltransferase, TrmH family [Thermoactinomyces sp. DSM 45891]|uniref:TrmH family RNA methyltransferase n=1 Tax=Thermoactinomyces sp. DSM 45891 TaxID=1761907 RepID=UPI000913BD7A|nr:RNA methyltransferase [Thermoactinomyces sp. DSM 45891]SFX77364.1 RNA methyltransferase, TrmH family [Thermoactinomyces sp. DSM 45891]